MSTSSEVPSSAATPPPPSAQISELPDKWSPEIDLEILSFLERVKKERNLKRNSFVVAVWNELGQHLVSKGHPGFTTQQLKERFQILKSKPKSSRKPDSSASVPALVSAPVTASAPSSESTSAPMDSAQASISAPPPASTPAPSIPVPTSTGDRASWTTEAEFHLMAHLVDAKGKAQMSDNNFKPVVYQSAARFLATKGFRYTRKQVKTRWSRFKKDFKIVATLRALSGFGWDPIRHMVTATDEVWDSYLKGHEKAKPFRRQPFPHYDDIATIVGHSTATGTLAWSSEHAAINIDTSSDEDGDEDDSDQSDDEDQSPKKKRRSATARSTPAPKRVRVSAGAQALVDMETSVSSLTETIKSGSLFAAPPTDSPVKKEKAFKVVREEEGLSPNSLAKVRRVFRGPGEIAREYLSFDSSKKEERSARHIWLMDEMEKL